MFSKHGFEGHEDVVLITSGKIGAEFFYSR